MTATTLGQTTGKQIPVKPRWPVIGDMFEVNRDVLGYLVRLTRAYPELVDTGGIILNHPALIEQVLVTHNQKFQKSKGLKEMGKPVFGNGLLASDGDFWLRQRRLAQPAFHRQRIAAYAETMTDFTERMMAGWGDGAVRDIHDDMMRLTLQIVTKTLFNKEADAEINEIGGVLDAIMDRFATRGPLDVFEFLTGWQLPRRVNRRFQWAVRRLDDIVSRVIAEQRASGEDKGDLLSMFLSARDDDGQGMSDQQLLDECKTMFLAGHETTALALSWTLWLLDANPAVAAKLRNELATVLAGRTPTLADLPQLRYTERVINESLRLMPPAWSIEREALEDVEIGGYPIKKGATVVMSQYAVQRDPRWFDEPERFDPDRWENDLLKRLPKFAYFPFGGGPRLCIGMQFALMEAQLLLATVAQKFEFELVKGHPVVPQPSITMRPQHGLKMKIRKVRE